MGVKMTQCQSHLSCDRSNLSLRIKFIFFNPRKQVSASHQFHYHNKISPPAETFFECHYIRMGMGTQQTHFPFLVAWQGFVDDFCCPMNACLFVYHFIDPGFCTTSQLPFD
eukprot:Lithocolla_globosa_v1_NODE_5369_length_1253_cov_6.342237.p2 type:complete len:111 gc:universal NODE_5369_length_1253_cov_6.342237:479-147(-)